MLEPDDEIFNGITRKIKNFDVVIDPYDLTYMWVSKKFCKIIGYDPEELIGEQIFKVIDRDKNDTRKIEFDMLGDESGTKREHSMKRKDGTTIKLMAQDNYIEINSKPYLVGTIIG